MDMYRLGSITNHLPLAAAKCEMHSNIKSRVVTVPLFPVQFRSVFG